MKSSIALISFGSLWAGVSFFPFRALWASVTLIPFRTLRTDGACCTSVTLIAFQPLRACCTGVSLVSFGTARKPKFEIYNASSFGFRNSRRRSSRKCLGRHRHVFNCRLSRRCAACGRRCRRRAFRCCRCAVCCRFRICCRSFLCKVFKLQPGYLTGRSRLLRNEQRIV